MAPTDPGPAPGVGPDARPARLVLLGHPVAHSLSPRFQGAALRAAGLAVRYEPLDVPPEALDATLDALVAEGAAGNVTIPHKEAVFARCAVRTPLADRCGAVNTFWVRAGALVGHNTDVAGALATITALCPSGLQDVRCAVLGAGGSAAAVLVALAQAGGRDIRVWARSRDRAAALAARVAVPMRLADSAAAAVEGAGLVVNATPVGLGADEWPVPPDALAAGCRVFDLVYRADGTAWVRACRARGLRGEDGLRMLVEQGAAAFTAWFGTPPDRSAMWAALGHANPPEVPDGP